jgi:hypothetical protein
VEACEIRIFALGPLDPFGLLRLALFAARFLLALLHLLRLFAVAFGECCFGWPSDGVLLSEDRLLPVYLKTRSPLKKKMTKGGQGRRPLGFPAVRKYKSA